MHLSKSNLCYYFLLASVLFDVPHFRVLFEMYKFDTKAKRKSFIISFVNTNLTLKKTSCDLGVKVEKVVSAERSTLRFHRLTMENQGSTCVLRRIFGAKKCFRLADHEVLLSMFRPTLFSICYPCKDVK